MRETDLYPPVKTFLEGRGYSVKGEIGDCDVVAIRGQEPPVIVELKRSFSLDLILQGVSRKRVSELVYLAVPPLTGRNARRKRREYIGLCRLLGLGLLTVRLSPETIEVLADPGPYQPRRNKALQGRLLGEFVRRVGDPAAGGATRRSPGMTAYRQDALRCALHLAANGPTKASLVAQATGVARARAILYRDVYGWFERAGTGIYRITPQGREALDTHGDLVPVLKADQAP